VDSGNIDFWGAIALGFFVGYVSMMYISRAVVTDAKARNLAAFLTVIISGTGRELRHREARQRMQRAIR
jgi:hypothetical protein